MEGGIATRITAVRVISPIRMAPKTYIRYQIWRLRSVCCAVSASDTACCAATSGHKRLSLSMIAFARSRVTGAPYMSPYSATKRQLGWLLSSRSSRTQMAVLVALASQLHGHCGPEMLTGPPSSGLRHSQASRCVRPRGCRRAGTGFALPYQSGEFVQT